MFYFVKRDIAAFPLVCKRKRLTVFGIGLPVLGIGYDVFSDIVVFVFGGDDVFVVIALPNGETRGITEEVDLFSDGGFENRDE